MITKIQKSGEKITIEYKKANPSRPDDQDKFKLESKEAPRPEFNTALQGLEPHILEILQLPSDYGDAMTVTGLSITESSGIRKIILKAKKELVDSNSPFNISTPKKPDGVISEDAEGDDVLTDKALEAIDDLIDEAERYVRGERNQSMLDLDAGDDAEEPQEEEQGEDSED
jgi:hypothetical protein